MPLGQPFLGEFKWLSGIALALDFAWGWQINAVSFLLELVQKYVFRLFCFHLFLLKLVMLRDPRNYTIQYTQYNHTV